MNPVLTGPLSPELLQRMDAYWRAANYLSVGQLYLYDNPLLKKPLELSHVKPLVVDHVVNKKADIVRVYLPPDANCLLSVFDHCLRSKHYVNVVVAGKRAMPKQIMQDKLVEHGGYIAKHGRDMPEILNWTWGDPK